MIYWAGEIEKLWGINREHQVLTIKIIAWCTAASATKQKMATTRKASSEKLSLNDCLNSLAKLFPIAFMLIVQINHFVHHGSPANHHAHLRVWWAVLESYASRDLYSGLSKLHPTFLPQLFVLPILQPSPLQHDQPSPSEHSLTESQGFVGWNISESHWWACSNPLNQLYSRLRWWSPSCFHHHGQEEKVIARRTRSWWTHTCGGGKSPLASLYSTAKKPGRVMMYFVVWKTCLRGNSEGRDKIRPEFAQRLSSGNILRPQWWQKTSSSFVPAVQAKFIGLFFLAPCSASTMASPQVSGGICLSHP